MPTETAQRTKTMTPYTQHPDQANPQTESSLEAARGRATAGGYRLLLLESENALQLERGDVCTTLSIYAMPLNCTLWVISCHVTFTSIKRGEPPGPRQDRGSNSR